MVKMKRGPKPKAAGEKKVAAKLWVKQKYLPLAEIDLASLEAKYEDEKFMDKELKKYARK